MSGLLFGYNQGLVDGVKAAWGARFIVTQDGGVDVLYDRQSSFGDALSVNALHAWLNRERPEFALLTPFQRCQRVLSGFLKDGIAKTREARPLILHQDSEGAIVANTNGSAGYCYVAAYRYDDLPEGLGTLGLDKIIEGLAELRAKEDA